MLKLRHPNIAQVVDFGILTGRPFLTMEMIRGRTLYAMIMQSAPFPPERAAYYARQIAMGLGAAHRLGIIHRDLKPANVMVVDEGDREVLKILDFGIARTVDAALGDTRLTAQDRLLGTPTYMAPEQILSPSNVTAASDLYSLGIVMYRMLRRVSPFEGTRSEVVDRQLRAPPPALDDHGALGRLVLDLLAKKPTDRPASAEEVIARLDEIGLDEPPLPDFTKLRPSGIGSVIPAITDASPPPTSLLSTEHAGGRKFFAGAFLFVLLATIAATLGYTSWRQQNEREVPPAPVQLDPAPRAELRPIVEPAAEQVVEPTVVLREEEQSIAPAKAKQRRRAKKRSPRPKDKPERLRALKDRYRTALKTHGLSDRDLAGDPTASTLFAEWNDALEGRDAARAERALFGLEQKLPVLGTDPAAIERKMGQLSARLMELAKSVPKEEIEALESRYFELRTSFQPNADRDTLEALGKKLRALERDVDGLGDQAADEER